MTSRGRSQTELPPASKESVTVVVRVRPLNRLELRTGQKEAWSCSDRVVEQKQGMTRARSKYKEPPRFTADYVATQDKSNGFLYDLIGRPLVESATQGYNVAMFAYGQTSSGKTYTIHGSSREPGMIPLSIEEIFSFIEDSPDREFVLRVSYMEIYNEVVNDLLNPSNTNLRVRESRQKGVFVEGLKEDVVMSADQVFSLLHAGTSHRHIGRTNYNDVSSRSHTIFRIIIESEARDGNGAVRVSHLNMVDLAGSENAVKAGSAKRIAETGYINKSLLTLGHVIYQLAEGAKGHVPFRDSKLTRILQASLSGKSKVTMCCNISPSDGNVEETISTLKFAARAKKVKNEASINERMDDSALLRQYRLEIEQLKRDLEEARTVTQLLMEEPSVSAEEVAAKEAETMKMLERNEQEKQEMQAKIEQLTRLILKSSRKPPPTQPQSTRAADAPSSSTSSSSSKKSDPFAKANARFDRTGVRMPPHFKTQSFAYGTLPRNFFAYHHEHTGSASSPVTLNSIGRRPSITGGISELDEVTGDPNDSENDMTCPTPQPMLEEAADDDTMESLREKLKRANTELFNSRTELEATQLRLEALEVELEEKNALLQEWDSFYVTNNNKQAAIQNELRKVAAATHGKNEDLTDLFSLLNLDEESFDSPLVEFDTPTSSIPKPGTAAPAAGSGSGADTSSVTSVTSASSSHLRKDSARFKAILNRFRATEQDT